MRKAGGKSSLKKEKLNPWFLGEDREFQTETRKRLGIQLDMKIAIFIKESYAKNCKFG